MTKDELSNKLSSAPDLYSFIVILFMCVDTEDLSNARSRYRKIINTESIGNLRKFQSLAQDLLIINPYEFTSWINLWIVELFKSPYDAIICAFHSLLRIDDVICKYSNSNKIVCDKGPFGKTECHSLFLKKASGFFDRKMVENKIRRGRQTVEFNPNSLNWNFKNFEVFNDAEFQGFSPKIQEYRPKETFGKSINFALMPLKSVKWSSPKFNDITEQFIVEYDQSCFATHNDGILSFISKANSEKVDILVFPELALNNNTESLVVSYLTQNSFSNLKLCFLGSKWHNKTNEALLISANGTLLIRQAKKTPYSIYNKVNRKTYYENINTQNNEIAFVDIEGIGRLAYLICADFNNESLISVCSVLHADFIFVSSYTNSTDNMEKTAKSLAERRAITTVLSNSCASIPDDRLDTTHCNFIVIPDIQLGRLSNTKLACNFSCNNMFDCKNCAHYAELKNDID